MSAMFNECNSLISLPDISKWNISNVKDMGSMFSGCNSLISLPDISKWETSNIENMSSMFYNLPNCIKIPKRFIEQNYLGYSNCIFSLSNLCSNKKYSKALYKNMHK